MDMLTLSATPIPRTLNMAMSGIRDMSVIAEPPQDRYPVQTCVMEYHLGVLVQARTETGRTGLLYPQSGGNHAADRSQIAGSHAGSPNCHCEWADG